MVAAARDSRRAPERGRETRGSIAPPAMKQVSRKGVTSGDSNKASARATAPIKRVRSRMSSSSMNRTSGDVRQSGPRSFTVPREKLL